MKGAPIRLKGIDSRGRTFAEGRQYSRGGAEEDEGAQYWDKFRMCVMVIA